MEIAHRGFEIAMPHRLLDGPWILAAIQTVRGVSVPQMMRRGSASYVRHRGGAFEFYESAVFAVGKMQVVGKCFADGFFEPKVFAD